MNNQNGFACRYCGAVVLHANTLRSHEARHETNLELRDIIEQEGAYAPAPARFNDISGGERDPQLEGLAAQRAEAFAQSQLDLIGQRQGLDGVALQAMQMQQQQPQGMMMQQLQAQQSPLAQLPPINSPLQAQPSVLEQVIAAQSHGQVQSNSPFASGLTPYVPALTPFAGGGEEVLQAALIQQAQAQEQGGEQLREQLLVQELLAEAQGGMSEEEIQLHMLQQQGGGFGGF